MYEDRWLVDWLASRKTNRSIRERERGKGEGQQWYNMYHYKHNSDYTM